MAKAITVKGVGKITAKPDWVVLSMTMVSLHMEYDKAMEGAEANIQSMNASLSTVGFPDDDVKTTGFNVSTNYEREKDRNGNYANVFNGYEVTHNLKLDFGFDMKRLSQALSVISSCAAHPQVNIAFTVKDSTAINEDMLRSAAENAKRTAVTLTEASGVHLGQLLAIDYNWGELDVYSHTRFGMESNCLMPMCSESINIHPDDIDVSDSATFTWELI